MSDAPLTDVHEFCDTLDKPKVYSEFARQLERENAELRKENSEWKACADKLAKARTTDEFEPALYEYQTLMKNYD